MRRTLPPLMFAFALLAAPAAFAGGGWCQNANGDSVRCHSPGAMPLGWTVQAGQPAPTPYTRLTPAMLLGLVGAVGGLMALIALMPDFQVRDGGWDEQQCDAEDERG